MIQVTGSCVPCQYFSIKPYGMNPIIVLAGATGNLGKKIALALLDNGAQVRLLVRQDSNPAKVKELETKGATAFAADFANVHQLAAACQGAHCVVSALSGLREVIIDAQKALADAAVQAGVPRFIPSDYSLDFTNLEPGQNRNLDLRREFHRYLETIPIQSTTIFNGAFMDLLTGDMPLILFGRKRIIAWGNPDEVLDFTFTDDVARFTALAALDNHTPRYLRIAGDRASARQMVAIAGEVTGETFKLWRIGGIGLLNTLIKITKTLSPPSNDLYPAWQGMQYMRDMMEGRVRIDGYANNRYPDMAWTTIRSYLKSQNVSERVKK
jgi:nucleoside-diphosphate-sugar epimerase